MRPNNLPRPIRLGLYALASAILLTLCLLPREELPAGPPSDKIEHAIAWFVLTLTGLILSPRRPWAIPIYALAFGIFVELMQAYATTGRHGDVNDFMVDALGVATAVLLWRMLPARVRG